MAQQIRFGQTGPAKLPVLGNLPICCNRALYKWLVCGLCTVSCMISGHQGAICDVNSQQVNQKSLCFQHYKVPNHNHWRSIRYVNQSNQLHCGWSKYFPWAWSSWLNSIFCVCVIWSSFVISWKVQTKNQTINSSNIWLGIFKRNMKLVKDISRYSQFIKKITAFNQLLR